MDTKVNYTILGAFVISLFAAITLAIIWLSSGFSIGEYATYEVQMQEAVTGLSIDAVVEYNGVNVGSVKKIAISHHNPHLVILLLSIKKNAPITQGTTASLNSRGLTGITYIALKDKGTNLKHLQKLPDQPYPIIKTEPSLFLQMDAALSKLNENVSKVTTAVSSILDAENQRAFKQILFNLNQVTSSLADNTQRMNSILQNTAAASDKLPAIVRSSSQALQVIQSQTLPAMNRTFTNIDDVTRNLSDLAAELKQNPAMLIRGKQPQPLGPGEK